MNILVAGGAGYIFSYMVKRLGQLGCAVTTLDNLGNGEGFSVQGVIDAAQRVTGRTIAVRNAPRREGDPTRLLADANLTRQHLVCAPQFPDLKTIAAHAWGWEQKTIGENV